MNVLIERMSDAMSDEDFVRLFYETSREEPILIALRLRLTSVIEHNVTPQVLVDTKQSMMADFETLGREIGRCLQLSEADARSLIVAFLALILGAAQADASPVIDPDLLPAHMQALMAQFHSEPVFLNNAALILKGLRQRD